MLASACGIAMDSPAGFAGVQIIAGKARGRGNDERKSHGMWGKPVHFEQSSQIGSPPK
jgi:hypothetical protein